MRLRAWARRIWRRTRLARAASKRDLELREFVYLDEVSVFSLISSRIGPIATEFTDTESSSLTSELAAGASATSGVLTGEVRSRMESMRSTGTQVLRKATVQATFRELYGHIVNDLALSRPPSGEAPDVTVSSDALARARGWAVAASDLCRGSLVEIEIVLEAEPIFHVSTLMDTFLELFQEAPDLLPPTMRDGLGDAVAMNAVMSKLLAGLVPLRAHAVHHVVLVADGPEWVVDRRLLDRLPPGTETRELDVVATAETGLFWKDLRRLLFNQGRYTMLCRIGRDGLQDGWNPVQLSDMARRMLPEAADQLDVAQRSFVALVDRRGAPALPTPAADGRLRRALQNYGRALSDHYHVSWALDDVDAAAAAATGSAVEEQRPAFAVVAQAFAAETGVMTDPIVLARLRYQALLKLAPPPTPLHQGPGLSRLSRACCRLR